MKKDTDKDIQKQSSPRSEAALEEQRISFSANLVSCLEDKKKAFNKKNKSSIKIGQLKEVYERGVTLNNQDLNLHGLARVNMFLRMKEQKMMGVISAKNTKKEKLLGLVLETESPQNSNKLIDISETWIPLEEDVSCAKSDIEKHKLSLDFKSLDELYLQPYRPIQLNWD